jgi:DNA repair exonuclease SbcCD ATPase subunit
MKITKVIAKNFQSYAELDFEYSDLGLTLVSGQTKAGKSTVMDAPCWILFGTTSKESAADDVRSWFAEEETVGQLRVELPGEVLWITRKRGKRSSQNDLYFQVEGTLEQVRGKDATDTQRMLTERLGVDQELYIAGSYLHQFSKADQFFISKAKDRRETLERIADLSLPVMLGERASEARKLAKKGIDEVEQGAARLEGKFEAEGNAVITCSRDIDDWEDKYQADLNNLQSRSDGYEAAKAEKVSRQVDKIEALSKMIRPAEEYEVRLNQVRKQIKALEAVAEQAREAARKLATCDAVLRSKKDEISKFSRDLGATCPTCLGPANNSNRQAHLDELALDAEALALKYVELEDEVIRLDTALEVQPKLQEAFQKIAREQAENKTLINQMDAMRVQVLALREERNPYAEQIAEHRKQKGKNPFIAKRQKLVEQQTRTRESQIELERVADGLRERITGLTWLYDKSFELRGQLLEAAVKSINDRTNEILDRFFDAEIRVQMTLADSDKLEVSITNEGYECPFKQLSGGERCLLKLAFSIAYMRAAENTAGIKFSTLMLDEAFNGLDSSLKAKAFPLLQSLDEEYSSILVIDHSDELKQLFYKQFLVTKSGAYSQIESLDAE